MNYFDYLSQHQNQFGGGLFPQMGAGTGAPLPSSISDYLRSPLGLSPSQPSQVSTQGGYGQNWLESKYGPSQVTYGVQPPSLGGVQNSLQGKNFTSEYQQDNTPVPFASRVGGLPPGYGTQDPELQPRKVTPAGFYSAPIGYGSQGHSGSYYPTDRPADSPIPSSYTYPGSRDYLFR